MPEDKFEFPTAEQVTDDVNFTETELYDEMVRQPSLVAHYGRLVAEAQFNMDKSKQLLEITESRCAQEMRDEAADEGRKITESQINSNLPNDAKVMKKRMEYSRAKADHEALKVALEALRHKKDMMIQINVGQRTEMENKISGLAKMESEGARDAKIRQAAKNFKAA